MDFGSSLVVPGIKTASMLGSLEELEIVFEAVKFLPPEQREIKLRALCPDNPQLRAEVQSLLASSESSAGILSRTPLLQLIPTHIDNEYVPQQLGAYTIIKKIGHGGMGTVFLAERNDGQFEKTVAIKLIRQSHSQEIFQRFLLERRLLAKLEHPFIARLIDGGQTEFNQPYLVMEYVKGLSLHEFCQQRQLSLTQKLELFCKICEAVHYAHQHCIIHRDLKPANILVDEYGHPKLLDFGIAKLMQEKSREQIITAVGAMVLTPEYAAPEQITGQEITPSVDVYALGVILYELLSGHRPYEVKSSAMAAMVKMICEDNPPPPSRVCAQEISTKLRGTLDHMVMHALEKDPVQRYCSVEDLSRDVQDFLNHQSIASTSAHRLAHGKWYISRRWLGLGMAGVIFLALISGFLGRSYIPMWALNPPLTNQSSSAPIKEVSSIPVPARKNEVKINKPISNVPHTNAKTNTASIRESSTKLNDKYGLPEKLFLLSVFSRVYHDSNHEVMAVENCQGPESTMPAPYEKIKFINYIQCVIHLSTRYNLQKKPDKTLQLIDQTLSQWRATSRRRMPKKQKIQFFEIYSESQAQLGQVEGAYQAQKRAFDLAKALDRKEGDQEERISYLKMGLGVRLVAFGYPERGIVEMKQALEYIEMRAKQSSAPEENASYNDIAILQALLALIYAQLPSNTHNNTDNRQESCDWFQKSAQGIIRLSEQPQHPRFSFDSHLIIGEYQRKFAHYCG